MAKKNKKTIISVIIFVSIIFVMLAVLFLTGTIQQSILFDDFITEEDFSIPSPALLQQKSVCQIKSITAQQTENFCEDSIWETKTGLISTEFFTVESSTGVSNGKFILQ